MRFDRRVYIGMTLFLALFLFTTTVYAGTITATAGTGGTITPSGKYIAQGVGPHLFAIAPDSNYQIAGIIVSEGKNKTYPVCTLTNVENCTFNGAVVTYGFIDPQNDFTIIASFAPIPVVANFVTDQPSGSEAGVSVQFTDTSENGPTIWAWDFGDGTTSDVQNPKHTFAVGSYNVTLTATNVVTNTFDTYTLENYEAIQPTITYEASSGANGSISPSGTVKVDEGSSTTFTIKPNQYYQVSNVLVDDEPIGAVTSVTFESDDLIDHIISASFAPIPVAASFVASPESGSEGHLVIVEFEDKSQNNPLSWTWNFDDGTDDSTDQHPVHTFAPGTYTVTLTIENNQNQTADSYSIEYTVVEPTITYKASAEGNGSISPSGTVTVAEVAEGPNTNTFTITPNSLYQVSDVLVDGESIGAVSSYTFTDTGDHSISAFFEPIPVIASFSANPASEEINAFDQVQFTNMSENNPASWIWDFDDGTTSTEMNPVHTFEEAGAYYVTLTVYNALSSQFDSFSINYTVNSNYLSRPVVIKNSSGGKGYLSIQDAYADISGLIETIRIKTGAPFIEDLFFDREIEVLIAGGYDDSFENVVNFSRVNGKVTISYGKVIVSNLIIGSLN